MARGDGERTAQEPRGMKPRGPVLDLPNYVPALLVFLANKLTASASARYRREFGTGVTEWRILSQLAVEPGATANRICQVIGFDKGPVSRCLAGLEARGMVRVAADPDDARRRRATLTPAGLAVHDRIIAVALERERRLTACLTADERTTLVGLLNRLHDNLPAVDAPEG